jgi:glucuronate isomerase
MPQNQLEHVLFTELCRIPLIDPHTHINPHAPAAKNLEEILGYHYYTELAHSAGMPKTALAPEKPAKERVRTILKYLEQIDNTAQYHWFVEIARRFLGFAGDRATAADCDQLWQAAEQQMTTPNWAEQVLAKTNVEKIFLTNDFDDPLEGFDTKRYVPCLRTDELVFHLDKVQVRERLAKATGVEVGDLAGLRRAVTKLFEHFTNKGAKACAISLPPRFAPIRPDDDAVSNALRTMNPEGQTFRTLGAFWLLAEQCREFRVPFDLMIGVNRRVYPEGVYQGQDLFDQRTSLIQFADLFNAFPEVAFCISVLSSGQNQELASYSWIFPNVVTSGHWWYSNIPAYIEQDCRARLQAAPKTKQIGYYSDAYKLEFIYPKFNMYRRLLAGILARDFVQDRGWTEQQALDLGRLILRDNVQRIFSV